MQLFIWESNYLADYYPGQIICMAQDVEAARERARAHLKTKAAQMSDMAYLSAQALLEDDIRVDPRICEGVLFIGGSG